MKHLLYPILYMALLAILSLPSSLLAAPTFVTHHPAQAFVWIEQESALPILVDAKEDKGILRAIAHLQADAQEVAGVIPPLVNTITAKRLVIIGSLQGSHFIQELVKAGKIDGLQLEGKREKFLIQTIQNPFEGVEEALVIAGSDKRGTIYGIYELSTQMGVSPWYFWADVPVEKQSLVAIRRGTYTDGEPAVKYRGIFLNDEWPSLGGWATATFGGFNSRFYEKVFELILRLKGNFLWPAMWASAFYDDDPLNGPLADEMGIVMSTSHHEPMGLAQQDWKRRGKGEWNYQTNPTELRNFWQAGMERCKDWESVITLAMRGDGDEAMSDDTNTQLLQKIVKDQRRIIEKVTGKKAAETPQVWALYKEVQDYYDQGMRVPDDVTLLLCDDNWGNVRRLPNLNDKPRKGGYGMYYHFDYVGAPRNSKWLNITQIERTWEQMNLTYEHGVRELWVVNVGDLKPMEYPITFFLDMAWNPQRFTPSNLFEHTEAFCAQQFGTPYATEAARLLTLYTKYNRRITPELLTATTYSLENYHEFQRVKEAYTTLSLDALKLYYLLPANRRDAYDQLILYPIQACANLYEMYYAVAMNRELAAQNSSEANVWADKVVHCFERDSLLTYHYNQVMSGGKWNHMMDQTHIGYTSWNHPAHNIMPAVVRLPEVAATSPLFQEADGYLSMEAPNYSRATNGAAQFVVIPNLGATLSGVTTLPCTVQPDESMALAYDFVSDYAGTARVQLRFSATLNFNDYKGMRYAVRIDDGPEEVVNINGGYRGELGKWQADHVITTQTTHLVEKAKQHTLHIRLLDAGMVFQKVMIDLGGLKPAYLGAPESARVK
ncbi:MAG: glycosyl hydrolase 115 family protein [Phocaeicola sp.]